MHAAQGPGNDLDEDLRVLIEQLALARPPVEVDGRRLTIAATTVEAYSGHIDDVLVAFIELIRLVRRGPEPTRMAFRRVDIEVLARQLSRPGEQVVDHLAALVGADDANLEAMNHSFEVGDVVIDSGLDDIDLNADPASLLRR